MGTSGGGHADATHDSSSTGEQRPRGRTELDGLYVWLSSLPDYMRSIECGRRREKCPVKAPRVISPDGDAGGKNTIVTRLLHKDVLGGLWPCRKPFGIIEGSAINTTRTRRPLKGQIEFGSTRCAKVDLY